MSAPPPPARRRAGSVGSGARRARAAPRRRTWVARRVGAAVSLLTALVIATALGGYLRLKAGPLDMGMAAPLIERMAGGAMGGGALRLDGVSVTLDRDGADRLTLALDGAQVLGPQARVLFSAPQVRLALDPVALLSGRVRPRAITVTGAQAVLTRQRDGRFQFGLAPAALPPAASPPAETTPMRPSRKPGATQPADFDGFAAALAQIDGRRDGPLSQLDSLSFERLGLRYVDYSASRVYRAARTDIVISRDAAGALAHPLPGGAAPATGVTARASMVVQGGAFGEAVLRAAGQRTADGGAALTVTFSGVSTRDLVDQIPALDGLQLLDAPLQGRATLSIAGSGALTAFGAQLRSGAGALRLGADSAPIDRATLAFDFDPARQQFDIHSLALQGPAGSVAGAGLMRVSRDGPDPDAATGVAAELALSDLRIAEPGVFGTPQRFDAGAVTLRADFEPARVELLSARLAQGPMSAEVSGLLWREEAAAPDAAPDAAAQPDAVTGLLAEGWRGEVAMTLRDLSARRLVALWPLAAAPGARRWLDANLEAGFVPRADFAASLGPAGPVVSGTFAYRDVVAHYLRPMPPITGAAGFGEVDLRRFALAMDAGAITAPDGGVVRLRDATLTLPDLDDPLSTSTVVATAEGPAQAVLAVLDLEPLALPRKIGLRPDQTAGAVEARAVMTLPLLRDLLIEQVDVAVEADIRDARAALPGGGLTVTSPALSVVADTARMRLSGDVVVDGQTAAVTLEEVFDPAEGAPGTVVDLRGRISTQALLARGVDAAPYADGAVDAQARLARFGDGRLTFDASLDLTPAALSASPLDWAKPLGAPAQAQVAGQARGDRVDLSTLSLSAPGLTIDGVAAFADGAVQEASLSRLRLDDRIDAAFALRRGEGGYMIDLTGALLDVGALGDGDGQADAGPATEPPPRDGPPISLTLAMDRLALTETLSLRAARGAATRGDGAVTAQLEGRVAAQGDDGAPASARLQVTYDHDGAGERVVARIDDFGALLRGADVFDGGVGGTATIDAAIERADGLALRGVLSAQDFVVSDDPGLRRMLEASDIDAARDSGVLFETVRAPFALRGDQLRLTDAVAYGPVIGVTLGGDIDTAAGTVDLAGVFTPAYSLNAAIGAVPVLGALLTGGEGQGVLAFDFSLQGDAADPEVSVNLLSALTPGILRQILAWEGGEIAPQPENGPSD